jgi:hypothetical protein
LCNGFHQIIRFKHVATPQNEPLGLRSGGYYFFYTDGLTPTAQPPQDLQGSMALAKPACKMPIRAQTEETKAIGTAPVFPRPIARVRLEAG